MRIDGIYLSTLGDRQFLWYYFHIRLFLKLARKAANSAAAGINHVLFRFCMPKVTFILLALAAVIFMPVGSLSAQENANSSLSPAEKAAIQERESLHLTTIGAFSAGFALQSYGYIGVLADALSKGVYAPDLVISMLGETTGYLRNISAQLKKYQDTPGLVVAGDRKFIASMMEIVNQLIAEAEALSSFARTKNANDLQKFEEARKNAWKNIRTTFGMN